MVGDTKLRICPEATSMFAIIEIFMCDGLSWESALIEATSMFAIIEIFMCDGPSWESAQKQHQCLLLLRFSCVMDQVKNLLWQKQHQCLLLLRFSCVMDQAENLLRSNINVCYYWDFHVWWTKLRIWEATSMLMMEQHQCLLLLRFSCVMDQAENLLRSNINVCYYWDFHVWWTKLRICSDRSNINVCYYWDFHVWWTKLRICSEATSMFAIIEIFMCDGPS